MGAFAMPGGMFGNSGAGGGFGAPGGMFGTGGGMVPGMGGMNIGGTGGSSLFGTPNPPSTGFGGGNVHAMNTGPGGGLFGGPSGIQTPGQTGLQPQGNQFGGGGQPQSSGAYGQPGLLGLGGPLNNILPPGFQGLTDVAQNSGFLNIPQIMASLEASTFPGYQQAQAGLSKQFGANNAAFGSEKAIGASNMAGQYAA